MLSLLHLLVFDADSGWRVEACGLRGWRPGLMVPRQLCVFESVPCREVRLHEMGGFARVQARRLSPFRSTGASAIRRGGRLHLWMWDEDEVKKLLADRVPPGMRRFAESLYLPWPVGDGVHRMRCTQTEDMVTCKDGVILEAGAGASLPLQLGALASKPLGFDWIGGALDASSAEPTFDGVSVFNRLGMLVAVAALGYLGYQGGRMWGGHEAAKVLEARLAAHASARGQWSGLESEVRADAQWLESYLRATAQVDVAGLLAALRPTMEAQGVVIRELDAAGTQLRVVFATAGGEMRLPELLQSLRALPGVQAVRLDQHKELGEATFVMDVTGFIRQASSSVTGEVGYGRQSSGR